jgi:hypothetical protein
MEGFCPSTPCQGLVRINKRSPCLRGAMKTKNVYIIAGPNGAGKTTFARKFLPLYAHCENFVNADLIAQGLSPFSPGIAAMKAGRLVLEQVRSLSRKNLDFAFETTLSGKSYLPFLRDMKAKGYKIHLFFLLAAHRRVCLGEDQGQGGMRRPQCPARRCTAPVPPGDQ